MDEQRKFVTDSPENSETPLEAICSWVTPTRLFFVRNHFDLPEIDPTTWKLSIEGCVDEPVEVTLEELEDMPQHTVFSTVECAGNGRSFLRPVQHGVQWGAGAIAHAEWTGVPLRRLLEKAGVQKTAQEVVFEGADQGTELDFSVPIPFARSLPLQKALHPDTLLALRMNGELLTAEHGYPVRLLVPGWYGVASVKWLTRIEVMDRPFDGYYQTVKYTIKKQTAQGLEKIPVRGMEIKSEIIRPTENETVGIGTQRIFGVAWAGEESVSKVEVSTDGGVSWGEANMIGLQARYSWALWEYFWEVAEPGAYSLMVRATSSSGKVQPSEHDPLRGGYLINFVRPRHVAVESRMPVAARDSSTNVDALLYDMNAFAEANAMVPLDVFYEFSEGGGI